MSEESLREAVRLLNEAMPSARWNTDHDATKVLAAVLDEHKAYKREVSDAAEDALSTIRNLEFSIGTATVHKVTDILAPLIIPEPPADPLLEAWEEAINQPAWISKFDTFRDALAKRNARIVIDAPDKPDATAVFTDALIAGGVSPDEVCAGHKWKAAIAVIAEALGK